mmetsp:Transcript_32540/g.41613  ORF Transcript_32540/g.41613 Transcript_32540/m.41613 type:complete len:90 (+) Transcript_32540:192-461(+)
MKRGGVQKTPKTFPIIPNNFVALKCDVTNTPNAWLPSKKPFDHPKNGFVCTLFGRGNAAAKIWNICAGIRNAFLLFKMALWKLKLAIWT